MKILVDTCIWSKVLRRRQPDPHTTEILKRLIVDDALTIIGPIRQELLSGFSDETAFQKLKQQLSVFPDISLASDHYEKAAEFSNLCRKNGIQGSNTDFLICATAVTHDLIILTDDGDFFSFQTCLPIKLTRPEAI